MDPLTWDPVPGLVLLLFSLAWAARRRFPLDIAAPPWPLPDHRPD